MRWGNEVLPENLKGKKHWDWPWPLRYIPRAWTSVDIGPPKILLGNQKEKRDGAPAPIGEPNSWQLSYYPGAPWWLKPFTLYFAYSADKKEDGKYRHFRLGTRYDDVDRYATLGAIATRRFTGEDSQDTSTH